nr:hypothetical protein [Candidatus Cloacimonadota bacterium]
MKRLFVMLFMLSIGLLTAVSITEIRAEDYSGVICRLVIQLERDSDFIVKRQSDGFFVDINGLTGNLPEYNLDGTFLDRISMGTSGILIHTGLDLDYETMRLSDRNAIVMDFFKKPSGKNDRLAIAKFYSDKGKLASADREFHLLAIDYPNHYDILYHWGELLIKRGSHRAAEKLAMIPPSSPYYAAAQELILKANGQTKDPEKQELENDNYIPLMPEDIPEVVEELTTTPQTQPVDEANLPSESQNQSPSFLGKLADWASENIIITIIIFVVLLIILCLMIFSNFFSPKKPVKKDIQEANQILDTDTMCKMVNRLLADGWTNKEIARELKVSVREIELIVRRLHYMEIQEDDSKDS